MSILDQHHNDLDARADELAARAQHALGLEQLHRPVCCIDDCPTRPLFHVDGHPDAVDLCAAHHWTACDCWDEAFDTEWCPLHGNAAARARVSQIPDLDDDEQDGCPEHGCACDGEVDHR